MNILALEFSSEQRSVAVLKSSATGAAAMTPATSSTRTSPRTLNAFRLIEATLHQAQLEREQIECVAVGIGPGSYTGIRAAISIAQAWQLAKDIQLLGIGSVEGLAAQAQTQSIHGRVNFIVDAQRNEFYLAAYEIGPAQLKIVEPLHLAAFDEVSARAQAGQTVAGPEADRLFPSARGVFHEASALAKLALTRTDFIPGEKLEPIYLRETNFVKAPLPRILPT